MSQKNILPNLIHGKWTTHKTENLFPVYNPSRGKIIAEVPDCGNEELEQAVQSAKKAFKEWSITPPNQRAQVFFKLKIAIEDKFEELSRGISREHGKTLVEARGDLRRGLEMIEYACGAPTLLMGESLSNIASGIDCQTERFPIGVVAGICPFNFPALVPMWMWPLAIACGNTFILKPSEKVPLTMQKVAQMALDCGLPKGVLNIIHGGKDMVNAILDHPDIKAISFVGSTPIAKYIYQRGCNNGKRIQAAGGAKNFAIIMEDANIEKTIEALRDGAYGCAGERCMASSTGVVVGNAKKTVLPSLIDAIKSMKTGPTDVDDAEQPNMGAVITKEHADKVKELITVGENGGAKIAVDGRKQNSDNGFFVGPTLIDEVDYNNKIAETEIFGPVLNMMHAKNIEEAVQLANKQAFGNGACIFTMSGTNARYFRRNTSAGMIGVNVAVPAPLAYFPFTGWNESFYGDLHMQGKEGVHFYTKQKTCTTRWFAHGEGDIWHKE